MCADVLVLSWLLFQSGGVLNPASVFYLVQIVVAALVLGWQWTGIVTGLSVAGYAALFLARNDALRAAQQMHPEIALHMRGMWLAFALTALIIAALVTRLAIAVERRDRALEALHDRTARADPLAGLATLATGAAHELSTPLATIAVAARELERSLTARFTDTALQRDARLIRAEIDRCRQVLDALAGHERRARRRDARRASLASTVDGARARLSPPGAGAPRRRRARRRVRRLARAGRHARLANLVQNAPAGLGRGGSRAAARDPGRRRTRPARRRRPRRAA